MKKNQTHVHRVIHGTPVGKLFAVMSAAVLSTGQVVHASSDYGPAAWNPGCSGYYTSGNGHRFLVIHVMEGYYESTISYFKQCSTTASVHYCVNGLRDYSGDAARGEITQMVSESNYAFHAICWNTYTIGTEHEGFIGNPAWFTEEMYQASADLQAHLCNKFGIIKDRNHVCGHDQKRISGWASWASANLGIDPYCNTHQDPGLNWEWSHFMNLIQGGSDAPRTVPLDASLIGEHYPVTVNVGETFRVHITMRNDGTKTWQRDGTTTHHMGTQNPVNNTRWGLNRAYMDVASVPSNKRAVFTIDATAPQTPGTYDFDWQMHEAGGNWFGPIVHRSIKVVVGPAPNWKFDASKEGWTSGNSISALTWTACCGWNGIFYGDQTGNDCFVYSPATDYGGAKNGVVNVAVYPQGGSSANHDMQVFWITDLENYWDAAKSSPMVSYTAQDQFVRLNLPVNDSKYRGDHINQLRLDFDNNNVGTRWIVDQVLVQETPKWWFGADKEGWTAGNGLSAMTWTESWGWPGIFYTDQTGNDAYCFSPDNVNYMGGANDKIHVRLYTQNGASNHDMKVYFTLGTDTTWNEAKSSAIVNYTCLNDWVDIDIPIGQNPLWSGWIKQIRLDFDGTNSGVRYLVDSIVVQYDNMAGNPQ